MTSSRERRAYARASARRGGTPSAASPHHDPGPPDTETTGVVPHMSGEPPDLSLAPPSDSSLVILPPFGASASTSTGSNPWSQVVAGSPHSIPAATTTSVAPPHGGSHGRFAVLAASTHGPEPEVAVTDDPTPPAPQAEPAEPPPRPLDFDDFQFLLGELTTLANSTADDWKIQNDRHNAYLIRMEKLDNTIASITAMTSDIMTSVATLRTQTDSAWREAVTAQDAVQQLRNTLRTSVPSDVDASTSLPTPSRTSLPSAMDATSSVPTPSARDSDIPAALASTHATVLNSLDALQHDLGLGTNHRPSSNENSVPPSPDGPPAARPQHRWRNADTSRWTPDGTGYDSDAAYAAAHASPTHLPTAVPEVRLPKTRDHLLGDDELSPRGGLTSTPRQRRTLLKGLDPHILQWHAGLPDGDPIDGVEFMEDSDVVALGIDPAFAPEMAEEHLDHIEHWTNPRWAAQDARHFGGSSYTPSSIAGPPITDILKQINTWDRLSDLSPTGWQAFYKKLRRYSLKWKISLVPFEAISLKYECLGHNLCHCGLGLARWRKMGDALFLILEQLLPLTNTTIATNLATLANSPKSANGYELLWTLLKEFVPMLDRTKPTPFPSWPDASDIFQYANLVLMYCDLARHHGPPYSEAMKSRMFLTNVRGAYLGLSTQYNAIISTYCPGRDGVLRCSQPLPRHLTVLELARTLHDDMLARAVPSSSIPPMSIQAFHTSTPSGDTPPALASIHSPMSSVTNPATAYTVPPSTRPTHIQGFVANLTRRQPLSTSRAPPNPTNRPAPSKRYEGTCAACGKYGHEAVRCDMLGMALFVKRYSSDRSNQESIREAEARWKERNKQFLPRDDRTPRTILANYCAELDFHEDTVDAELDWEFLATESAPLEQSE